MKKLMRFFLYLFFFIGALLFFLPKVNLYYQGEKLLEPFGIVIDNEQVHDHGFSTSIEHAGVYVKGIDAAVIGKTTLDLWLVYNHIELSKIAIASMLKSALPTKIESISITQALWNPTKVSFEAQGDFGEAYGDADLVERVVVLHLEPSKLMKTRFRSTMRLLKKDKEGGYRYEYHF